MIPIERHPLKPFLPTDAQVLFLGSFPPDKKRWSMEFFYPNFLNDMWRIWGILFFDNMNHFIVDGEKRFDLEKVMNFCTGKGIALYDTATAIRRLQATASDKYLEVVETTDIAKLLSQIPSCKAIVTTGDKATSVITGQYHCNKPRIGESVNLPIDGKTYELYRMPSSSRAYPLALSKKAEAYSVLMKYFKKD